MANPDKTETTIRKTLTVNEGDRTASIKIEEMKDLDPVFSKKLEGRVERREDFIKKHGIEKKLTEEDWKEFEKMFGKKYI